MKKFLSIMLAIALSAFLTACGGETAQSVASDALGMDASAGKELTHTDTHGGFHGDGMTHIVLEFAGDTFLDQIEAHAKWKPFPLDDVAAILVYGITENTGDTVASNGPVLAGENGHALIPKIENGYYIVIDRHTQTEQPILSRASFNFTVGVYDADRNTLHVCKFDT